MRSDAFKACATVETLRAMRRFEGKAGKRATVTSMLGCIKRKTKKEPTKAVRSRASYFIKRLNKTFWK